MTWKEQINEWVDLAEPQRKLLINIVSTEIIEKLIADIPNPWMTADDRGEFHVGTSSLKQQLRDKWLN